MRVCEVCGKALPPDQNSRKKCCGGECESVRRKAYFQAQYLMRKARPEDREETPAEKERRRARREKSRQYQSKQAAAQATAFVQVRSVLAERAPQRVVKRAGSLAEAEAAAAREGDCGAGLAMVREEGLTGSAGAVKQARP